MWVKQRRLLDKSLHWRNKQTSGSLPVAVWLELFFVTSIRSFIHFMRWGVQGLRGLVTAQCTSSGFTDLWWFGPRGGKLTGFNDRVWLVEWVAVTRWYSVKKETEALGSLNASLWWTGQMSLMDALRCDPLSIDYIDRSAERLTKTGFNDSKRGRQVSPASWWHVKGTVRKIMWRPSTAYKRTCQ